MIRFGQNADRLSIGRVYAQAWKAAYKGMAPQSFLDALTDENCAPPEGKVTNCFVAEENGEIIGVVNFGSCRNACSMRVGELRSIYVLPQYWRTGVGNALFRAASAQLREDGYDGFYLWVLKENARARRFYARMGMEESGAEREIEIGGARLEEVRYTMQL